MEIEGLVRAVQNLHEEGFGVELLVTDWHSQISKWVRENISHTDHQYDIWHVAKGISLILKVFGILVKWYT